MNRTQYEGAIREIVWQKVFDRRKNLVGYETLLRTAHDIRQPCASLAELAAEYLFRLRLHCFNHPLRNRESPVRLFVNVERAVIVEPGVIEGLLDSAPDFHDFGYTLSLVVGGSPLAGRVPQRAYIDGLIRLQHAGLAVVLADPDLHAEQHQEFELGLCQSVKLSMGKLRVPAASRPDFVAAGYDELRSRLFALIERYRIPLWAAGVDGRWQQEVVSGLPFALLQGRHLARPVAAPTGFASAETATSVSRVFARQAGIVALAYQ